ncbi:RDD family protein [Fontimonas sp. SYSU GA230001]|uniref:RDD family protein n=1 Tax=Fontimonas sp. SYSU GA230001 TaxID=3142450 RepID=UPI0032B35211
MMLPAPIWRRFAAAVYDGLLLLGLWMVALMIDTVVRDVVGIEREWHALRAYLFLIGLAFFGWFWTHGGQTLGMRAWRLHLRRSNGQPPRWIDAALRYALMLVCWGIVLTPALLQLPRLASAPHAKAVTTTTVLATALGLLLTRLDARRRAPQDWLSGTETGYEPSPPR